MLETMEVLTYSKNLLEYRQFLSVTIDHFPTIQANGLKYLLGRVVLGTFSY